MGQGRFSSVLLLKPIVRSEIEFLFIATAASAQKRLFRTHTLRKHFAREISSAAAELGAGRWSGGRSFQPPSGRGVATVPVRILSPSLSRPPSYQRRGHAVDTAPDAAHGLAPQHPQQQLER